MPRWRDDEWVSGAEAAKIMTKHTDHEISMAYVRWLATHGKIRSRQINKREKEYFRKDVQEYIVQRRYKTEEPAA